MEPKLMLRIPQIVSKIVKAHELRINVVLSSESSDMSIHLHKDKAIVFLRLQGDSFSVVRTIERYTLLSMLLPAIVNEDIRRRYEVASILLLLALIIATFFATPTPLGIALPTLAAICLLVVARAIIRKARREAAYIGNPMEYLDKLDAHSRQQLLNLVDCILRALGLCIGPSGSGITIVEGLGIREYLVHKEDNNRCTVVYCVLE